MVLRKPEEEESFPQALPPYPVTPSEDRAHHADYFPDTSSPPAFHLKTPDQSAPTKPEIKDDSESDYSDDEWNRSDDEFEHVGRQTLPDTLKPGGGKAPSPAKGNGLPAALRAGPSAGIPFNKPLEAISPMPTGASLASSNASERSNGSIPLQTNNPYLNIQPTGQSNWGGESSQDVWGDSHGHSQTYDQRNEPAELPAGQSPVAPSHQLNKLALDNSATNRDRSHSIDQPPLIAIDSPTPSSAHPKDSFGNPEEPLFDVSSLDAASRAYGLPEDSSYQHGQRTWQEQQDWERSERERRQREAHAAQEAAIRAEQERKHEEEFYRLEQQAPQHAPPPPPPAVPSYLDEPAPSLPPRRSFDEQPPAMPPRPIDTGFGQTSTSSGPESPNTTMNRQRKEHYQIKHIRWFDYNKSGIRTSPILTQNLNGPCPLLALVNALVLSTPAAMDTALIETLRTRETISLGLLLDAVFDELMSGRRGDAAQALPDVGDLYKFLLALHTGLNVNPMFVPEKHVSSGNASLTNRAGSFEDTSDMKLYRTFDIPLMHGWLPEAGSEAYIAFDRVAKSYETSQYIQFQEEELDAKLQTGQSLTPDEQQMFSDIHVIKEFLNRWPTQLTDHGLKVMRDTLHDGQFAILFRNDHFSTLCKDPRTGKLLTLVTDQGYSTHDEIVWESLTDVNGQGSQLFSGDFRSVDNTSAAAQAQEELQMQNLLDQHDDQGWTTVQGRRGNQQSSSGTQPVTDLTSAEEISRAEQEDHDLALALQLQEEEEDRQRRDRENELSRNAIQVAPPQPPRPANNNTRRPEQAPAIPPRRNNVTTHRPSSDPVPPPTYEEASTTPRYNPPPGHPANPQAPIPQPGSAFQASGGNVPPRRPNQGRPMQAPNILPGRPGRRQSGGPGMIGGPGGQEDRDKCVVM